MFNVHCYGSSVKIVRNENYIIYQMCNIIGNNVHLIVNLNSKEHYCYDLFTRTVKIYVNILRYRALYIYQVTQNQHSSLINVIIPIWFFTQHTYRLLD